MNTASRIIDFLDKPPCDEITPKKLALILHLSHETVKKACQRLYKEGKIGKGHRGYYRSLKTVVKLEDPDMFYAELYLHAIKFEYRGPLCPQVYREAYLLHGNYSTHRHKINHSITHYETWHGHKVTFTTHQNLIEVYIKVDKKIGPLSVQEFREYCAFIIGKESRITENQWYLVEHDFGIKDTPLIQLKDHQRISMKVFKNMWVTMYNKFGKLRIEGNFISKDVTMSDALIAYAHYQKSIHEVVAR